MNRPIRSGKRGAASGLSRREWLSLAGLGAGSALVLPGCQALQQLDTSAAGEGTGVQIVGAIMVLARYRASSRQQAVAEEKSRRVFVDRAMRPALADAKRKVRQKRQKEEAVVRRRPIDAPAREQAVAQVRRDAERELAALDNSWRKAAANYTDGRYTADFAATGTTTSVAFAPLKESQILTASASYVPRFLAVPVPAEKAIAGAAASVMFWDARSHQLAKNDVYVIDHEPRPGEVARFDDISAQYER